MLSKFNPKFFFVNRNFYDTFFLVWEKKLAQSIWPFTRNKSLKYIHFTKKKIYLQRKKWERIFSSKKYDFLEVTSSYTLNIFFTGIFAQNNILSLKKIISEIRPTVCEKYFFNCARFENKKYISCDKIGNKGIESHLKYILPSYWPLNFFFFLIPLRIFPVN